MALGHFVRQHGAVDAAPAPSYTSFSSARQVYLDDLPVLHTAYQTPPHLFTSFQSGLLRQGLNVAVNTSLPAAGLSADLHVIFLNVLGSRASPSTCAFADVDWCLIHVTVIDS